MILITGSAGFIGFHLSKYYLDKGRKVIGVDNLNNYYDVKHKINRLKILRKYKNFKFIKIDLKIEKNLKKLDNFKNKINFIVHLAGQAGVRYSILQPSSYIKNNIEAYIYLLEYFKQKKNIKTILYASSSSIYGDKKNLFDRDNKMISIYAVSKKTLEHISNVYNQIYGLRFIGMRFFTVYGPFGRPDMSIFKFFNKISTNKPIDVYNFGNHFRSFTYISDIIENIDKLIKWSINNKNKKINEVVNIGNPKSINLKYLITKIEENCNRKAKKKYLPLQTGDIVRTKAEVKKEIKKYNFKFKINLNEGINNFAKWFFYEKK